MAGAYEYESPSGEARLVGDPTINVGSLEGFTFVGQQGVDNAVDPLIKYRADRPSIYSDSSTVVAGETALGTDISNTTLPQAEIDAMTASSQESQKFIQDRMDALDKRRQEEIASIKESSAQAGQQLGKAQKKETGTTSVGIARMGGYLGESASAQGVMLNLEANHRREISALESKKNEAIRIANNAYNDQDFKLATTQLDLVKDLEKTISDRKETFFNQTLELTQEGRRKDEYSRKHYKEELERLSFLGDDVPQTKLDEIDSFYGISGFSKRYVSLIKKTNEAATEKELIASQQALVNLLKDIPAGLEISMPDGTTYTGIGKSGDIVTFKQTDSEGNVSIIDYNKMTGEMSIKQAGKLDTPSGDVDGKKQFAQAVQVVKDNAGKSESELKVGLREHFPDVSDSDINAIIYEYRQFIDIDYIKDFFEDEKNYTKNEFQKIVEDAGFRGFGSKWSTEKENYLNAMMENIELYRETGITDDAIFGNPDVAKLIKPDGTKINKPE